MSDFVRVQGVSCEELTCPIAAIEHNYNDRACGYVMIKYGTEFHVSTKMEARVADELWNLGYGITFDGDVNEHPQSFTEWVIRHREDPELVAAVTIEICNGTIPGAWVGLEPNV